MKTISRLVGLLDGEGRRRLIFLAGLMTFGSLLEAVGIGLILPYLTAVTEPTQILTHERAGPVLQLVGITGAREIQIATSLGIVGVFIGKSAYVAFMWRRVYQFLLSEYVGLADRLLQGYLTVPYTFHLQRNTAELIRNTTSVSQRVFVGAVQAAVYVVTEFLLLIALVGVLMYVHTIAAAAVLGIMAVAGFGLISAFRQRLEESGDVQVRHQSLMIQTVNESLGSLKETKLLGREENFIERFRRSADAVSASLLDKKMIGEYPRLLLETGAVVAMVSLAGVLILTGPGLKEAIPVLGVFGVAAVRLMPSVNRVVGNVNQLRYQKAAIDVAHKELEEIQRWKHQDHSETSPSSSPTIHFRDRVKLRNVAYRYPDSSERALKDISFDIERGQHVGVVGRTGSGKTTLVNLILGLLSPTTGTIRVDGTEIRKNLSGWQRKLGYIPQEIYLTDASLRSNVAFGLSRDEANEDQLWRSLERAQIADFVRELSEGLDTVVGERGIRVSGGQRQRIAIARALYHEPDMLILDEATSSLDYRTERKVMEAVEALAGEKTIVTVTHRLKTVEDCDIVHVFDNGRLVSSGSYQELAERSSAFRDLLEAQDNKGSVVPSST